MRFLTAVLAVLAVLSAFLVFPWEAGAQTGNPSLSVSNITPSSVTLTISGHSGQWWYRTNHVQAQCTDAGSGASTTATGLQASTSYSIAAYDSNDCGSRISNFVNFTTTRARLTAENNENYYSAKLTISGVNSAWWYMGNHSGAQCTSVPAGTTTATLSNLSAGTTYNYTAYSTNACATSVAISNKVVFSTPGVSAGDITGTSVSLTMKNWNNKDWWYEGVPDKTTVIPTGVKCTKVPAGTSKKSVTGLLQGVTYNFTAYSKKGCSGNAHTLGYASLVQTTVPTETPPRVSKFWAQTGPGIGRINLTWERPSGWNITSYSVRWKRKLQSKYVNFQSVSGTSTSHSIIVEPSTTYDVGIYYYVKPDDTSLNTKPSAIAYSYARSRGWDPAKPTGFTATPGLRSVAVSWNKVASKPNITISGYRLSWISGDFNYGPCPYPAPGTCAGPNKDVGCKEVGSGTSSYGHSGLTAGKTYKFRVRAKSSEGEWGECSDVVSGVALYPAPGTVTGVSVTAGVGNLSVGWTAVTGASGYKVQWKSGSENWSSGRQNDETGTTSSITGLTAGTEHTVRVIATKTNSVDASPSNEVKGTPYAQTPGQVQGLTVSAPARGASGVGKLNLSWSSITGATGFHVRWKSGAQSWSSSSSQKTISIASVTADTLDTLGNNTEYTVRVRAIHEHAQNHGAWSSEATGTTNPGPPGKATGVSVTAGVGNLSVGWTAVTGASGYKVQWKSGSENWSSSRQNDETGTSSTISNLNSGTTYVVRVIAYNTDGDAAASQTKTGIPKYTKPAKVTGVAVAVEAEQLSVSWSSVSGAENYVLQWKSGSEDWSSSRQNTGSDPGYTITGLTAAVEHTVRVKAARRHADDGDWSDTATGTPKSLKPGQVSGVKAESASEISGGSWVAKLKVSWKKENSASGYLVQWKDDNQNFDSSRQATIDSGNTTTHTIATGLTAGTEYTVRVKAKRNNADDGDWSPTVKGTPKHEPPDSVANLTLTPGTEQLAVSWTAVSGAEKYVLQWKSGVQGWDTQERQAIITETSYTIQGLRGGVEHTVRVMARREHADDGPPSQNTGTPNAPPVQQPQGSDGTPGGGSDETPEDGDDDAGCPDIAPYETAADVERERDPDTLMEFVQEARVGVESILGEETDENEAIDRLVECFGVAGSSSGGDGDGMSARVAGAWMSGSIYLFAITDGRKYFLAPRDSGLAGTHLNLVDENGCDVAAEIIRAARGEELQCEDLGLLPEGDARGFLQYLWDNPADTSDDSEPGYKDRGEAPGDSPKLSYVEGITDEGLMPDGVSMIMLGSGYYPGWEPPGSGPQPPSPGGGDGGGGCAVAGTGGAFPAAGANLLAAALFLAFAALRRRNLLM